MSTDAPPSPEVPTKAMPGWAKALVAFFWASLVLLVIGIVVGSAAFAKFQYDARDPALIAPIARDILHIETLPPELHYTFGYNFMGTAIISMSDAKENQNFVFMRTANVHNLVQENLQQKLPEDPTQPGGELTVKSKGEEEVAGHKMPYVLGTLSFGADIEQMRGAILTGEKKFLLRFTGTSQSGKYDMDLTKKLLSSLKGPL